MSGLRARFFGLLGPGRVALQRRSPRAVSSCLEGRDALISLATRNPQPATRTAFTLIEVLIVITIIATLSAAFLGVSSAAMEGAREARTKTTINKLNTLLMEKWATYSTRRVDVDSNHVTDLRDNIFNSTLPQNQKRRLLGMAQADLRLLALRELMLLEMPDRWSDVLLNPVDENNYNPRNDPRMLGAFPTLTTVYRRRYQQLLTRTGSNEKDIVANQGAECLYMIIMLATGDGEARTLFGDREIGDVDNDGAPEFLDGWGRPIHFIRWPAGFFEQSDLMLGDSSVDADPFDVFRRDNGTALWPGNVFYPVPSVFLNELRDNYSAFRLMPLIYSAGSDGETDINVQPYNGTASSLDPYTIDPSTDVLDENRYVFGHPVDTNNDGEDNSIDNIHNHLLDNR